MKPCLKTSCQRWAIILQALTFVFSRATVSCHNGSMDQEYHGWFLGAWEGFEIKPSLSLNSTSQLAPRQALKH